MAGQGDIWTLAQTMIWVCNVLGDFAKLDEINVVIDDFEYRPGKRERSMLEGFARIQNLPKVQAEPAEAVLLSPEGDHLPIVEIGRTLTARWWEAEQAVTKALRKGSLKISGRPRDGGHPEEIGPLDCRHIVFRDGDTPYAECAYDPNVKRPAQLALPRWDNVRFDADAVIALWPHPSALPRDAMTRTGAPGRPSGMHIVLEEAKRRRQSGETLDRVSGEARALREWYVKNYPNMPPPTAKTIENKIRGDHRQMPRN